MKRVASNLKKLRIAKGMTQDQLAEKLHVVRQTVSLWENGKREPDIDTLIAIADALDADVTELIYGPKPADNFAAGKQRRLLRAAICSGLFLLFLLANVLWEPLFNLLGVDCYSIWRFRLALSLPVLMYTFCGVAIVFSLAVSRNFRIQRRWLRILLVVFFLLVTGGYLAATQIWMPGWYMRIFDFFAHNTVLFLPPGIALGLGLHS